ncbi:ETEC_3214 domain-containing protein [Streptomyces nogalater]
MTGTDGEHKQGRALTFGERFKNLTERNLALVVLLYVSSAVTAVSTFITAYVTGGRWYQQHFNWQAGESAKLAKLHAGYTLAKFEELLGLPSIQVSLGKTGLGNLTQNSFQPRSEYWVDAVTDSRNQVVAYAVTSCDSGFNPSFTYWDGRRNRTVSLNKTPFSSALHMGTLKAHYSPTLAPHYYFAIQHWSALTINRSYAAGVTNLCPWKAIEPTHPSTTWNDWYDRSLRNFKTKDYILSISPKISTG